MGFIVIVALVALSIAGSAAFFSVYGLASLFSGMFWPVVFMGTSLEAGKLVAASYLYRFWDKISIFLKAYMLLAVGVLMLITSTGIFGFLTMGYQQDIQVTKTNEQQIEILSEENEQLQQLKQERLERKKQIDTDIASLPNDYITGRQRLMNSYGPELKQLKQDIEDYTNQIRNNTNKISNLKAENLEQEVHVGPIIFIAKVFDKDVDDTTKWLILIIIFAFDPMAVALTVAANVAVEERRKEKERESLDEPEPKITSVEQINDNVHQEHQPNQPEDNYENVAVDLESVLEKLNEKEEQKELTPQEIAQKDMLEEIFRRRAITKNIRQHKT